MTDLHLVPPFEPFPDDLLALAQAAGVVPPFRCEQTWEGSKGIARCVLPQGHDSACVLGIHT